jgi:transcriptional regulator with XRE-family HTH domain
MGRSRRPRPAQLAAKLRQIRTALGLTQDQMFIHLGETKTALYPGHISLYEAGQREPPLSVLLCYARIAGVYVDALIDDEVELPERLPTGMKSAGMKRSLPIKRAAKSVAKRKK